MAVRWIEIVKYACVGVCTRLSGIACYTCKIHIFWKFTKFLLYFKLEFVPRTLIITNGYSCLLSYRFYSQLGLVFEHLRLSFYIRVSATSGNWLP
jgi:hypothetical protein